MGALTAVLAEAVTSHDVVKAVAKFVLSPFEADGLVFQILESGRLNVVGATGYSPGFLMLLDGTALAAHAPIHDVMRTRSTRFVESKADLARRNPTLRHLSEVSPKEAWPFLPMIASGRAIGMCGCPSVNRVPSPMRNALC